MKLCTLLIAGFAAAAVAPAVTIEQYHSHDFAFTAQYAGNPFDVDVRATFQGPGGVRLEVPGFYDGAGVWKIRFSPTLTGRWNMRTGASVDALNGRTEADIVCEPNRSATIHGGLLVDALHPYHFIRTAPVIS
jgi:hypothetical protein